MPTLADKIISFSNSLEFKGSLPRGVKIMNPFKQPEIKLVNEQFYKKYFNNNNPRHIILGINPGRHGAGITGICFTDTKRLEQFCGIKIPGIKTNEISSVFIYDVINAYGGAERFYSDFYLAAVCPLGFTKKNVTGKHINYNYYDSRELYNAVYDFIVDSLRKEVNIACPPTCLPKFKRRQKSALGGRRANIRPANRSFSAGWCICLGNNANYKHLNEINQKEKFFKRIIPLEHPRFIMQYRLKKKEFYINKYLAILEEVKSTP